MWSVLKEQGEYGKVLSMNKKLICLAMMACILVSGCSLFPRERVVGVTDQHTDAAVVTEAQTAQSKDNQKITERASESEAAVSKESKEAELAARETESAAEQEKPENTIILATDMHYIARELTDGGPAFAEMVEHGDGKVVPYISEIMDAFLDEVIASKPGALILSGDITFEGERLSHEELAAKLVRVKKAGIPVLVIPGNHDINNPWAASYSGIRTRSADTVTSAEFREIYQDFGYQGAVSYDPNSLSYLYQLDEKTDLLMLDSCQYEPENLVGGFIGDGTYDWIEDQLIMANEEERNIIPVSHHNLLEESEIYVDDCTIEHGEQLARMLVEWNVKLYLSGHLHVQHMKDFDDGGAILEIVTSSLATPPCQYGVLDLMADGSYCYRTQILDMEAWAEQNNSEEEDLLNFDEFRTPFLERVFFNQAYDQLEDSDFENERKQRMSKLYATLNRYYYAGRAYEIREQILKDPYYQLWDGEVTDSILPQYILSILNDATWNYNHAVVE